MLAFFTIKKTFYKLQFTLIVDCEKRTADATVKYDRRIVAMSSVPFYNVDSPEAANRWLSETRNEHGNVVEYLERQYRLGIARADVACLIA